MFWAAFAYFAIIGLAFMLIQIAFLQRFSVYLGHPTYTFSIILFLMILSAGLGSLASERIDLERHQQVVWLPVGIAAAVFVETMLMQPVVDLTVGWGLPGRNLVVTAFVAPLACALGCCFPLGLRLVGRHSDRVSAWMWGVNGACGVMASILAVMGSMWLGIHVNLLVAAALVCPARRAVPAPRGGAVEDGRQHLSAADPLESVPPALERIIFTSWHGCESRCTGARTQGPTARRRQYVYAIQENWFRTRGCRADGYSRVSSTGATAQTAAPDLRPAR